MISKEFFLLALTVSTFPSITSFVLDVGSLNRTSFPDGFIFDKIKDRSNGDVALDHYHRYKEDVQIIKNINMDAYRFSISWSRILPKGTLRGGINQKGIKFCNNLIDELITNGLQPFVTLFHWDLPQALEDQYDGFLSPRIIKDFQDYAELCFKEFGDRVKHWITLNEPWSYSRGRYAIGIFAPGRCSEWRNPDCVGGDSGKEPYLATHYQLLAHGAAVKLYRKKFQTASDWLYVYPRGFRELLLYTKENYNNPLIYVTENGIGELEDPTLSLEEALLDTYRIDFYYRHLCYLHLAIRDGVNVKGYFAWSFLDNFEWSDGYSVRFGMNFVDYKKNLSRYPKLSARWFKNFLEKN